MLRPVAGDLVHLVDREGELGPDPGDLIIDSKKTQSIHYGTELEVLLGTFLDVDTLIIMEIKTNTCVQCAGFESLNRGYQVARSVWAACMATTSTRPPSKTSLGVWAG